MNSNNKNTIGDALTVWAGFGIVAEWKRDVFGAAVFGGAGGCVLAGRGMITNFADEPFSQAQGTIVDVPGELGQHPVQKLDESSCGEKYQVRPLKVIFEM